MAVRVVSNVTIEPEAVDEYLAYWRQRSGECRAEPGALQYQVFRSIEEPNEFALLELWSDQETYDAHWAAQRAIPDRPTFPRAPRSQGRDGIEFYEQRYYRLVDGRWVPADEQGDGER
ncbi:antibiotic biosynthesis monooxygenase [Solwaraspora sp. WMMD1047]|uniref:putative quinol monooxygenase n=1 Tax=Solwaraspora sp. WMMD1047 TaxID=3016102 RepID=UPI00241647CB|nr:antibiotic biosynthesis monooxygenase family protein [Solwaraspora sp. WMMD1047]MDG4834346.1 antibiotic biosynthesis monooxygenase [Solwaraspora sp. WMMD1047]